jgi:hypothetical protein
MFNLSAPPVTQVCAIQRIIEADAVCHQAKADRTSKHIAAAECALQAAIDAATDDGVTWQTIGDALGIRRGNAYQRFRRRSRPSRTASP